MSIYILPIFLLLLFIYGCIKKINMYDSFVVGAKKSFQLVLNIFPYITAIMISITLLRVAGITDWLTELLSPIFFFFGIPTELCELILLRPFTGSGSFGLLENIFASYGADSYIARTACVIAGSTETVFYCASVYFAETNVKKLWLSVPIALFCGFVGALLASLFCKIM